MLRDEKTPAQPTTRRRGTGQLACSSHAPRASAPELTPADTPPNDQCGAGPPPAARPGQTQPMSSFYSNKQPSKCCARSTPALLSKELASRPAAALHHPDSEYLVRLGFEEGRPKLPPVGPAPALWAPLSFAVQHVALCHLRCPCCREGGDEHLNVVTPLTARPKSHGPHLSKKPTCAAAPTGTTPEHDFVGNLSLGRQRQ
jgi:hypothetical protein